jgi:N-methylhydantoinase A/oxoprolinase/acetone carboxylase beta subunit
MNALLEGDVASVGIVGFGSGPDARRARKRTAVGDVRLAPGHRLRTEHAFIDATGGLDPAVVDTTLKQLQARGCTAIAVSGAFSVDDGAQERLVCERARAIGLPACAGHELTGSYGLETRTISAAINASILGVVEHTASVVERVLHEAGVDVPLLVLRGDGGAMSLEAFRKAPSLTIGSGPAAGVAAALHDLALVDAIVLECGGTSSNVSVIKHGRTVLRDLRVMGRPTAIRSVDSWVVGAAGGSMARAGRRKVEETGPRSAHVAGLPYACFAASDAIAGAELELVAPRASDPESYAVVARDGRRWALTATCAAVALGLVDGQREVALAAFGPLARRMGSTPGHAARALLDGAVDKIAAAVAEAARVHGFPADVPVVALGGAGPALAGEVARRVGRPLLSPAHPEILSSIGAAVSLVRAAVARSSSAPGSALDIAHEAERLCVNAGAAPQTVMVETAFEAATGLLRAVATGAVALESGAAGRQPVDAGAQLAAAAGALHIDPAALQLVGQTAYYRVFSENGSGRVAVVDGAGSVPLAQNAKRVVCGDASALMGALRTAVEEGTISLGLADLLPRVALVCGSRIVDMSDSRRSDEILATAEKALDGQCGEAVAVLWH